MLHEMATVAAVELVRRTVPELIKAVKAVSVQIAGECAETRFARRGNAEAQRRPLRDWAWHDDICEAGRGGAEAVIPHPERRNWRTSGPAWFIHINLGQRLHNGNSSRVTPMASQNSGETLWSVTETVCVSTDVGTACHVCGHGLYGDRIHEKINHYFSHDYRLLHVGAQTTRDDADMPWQTTVAVLGKV